MSRVQPKSGQLRGTKELLQGGSGNLLQSGAIVSIKWGNCYKVGQYNFVTLGRMETHVY